MRYKQLILTLFLCCLGTGVALAQSDKRERKKGAVVKSRKAKVNMYHNAHDLEKLTKVSLRRIYVRRIIALYEVMPFAPLVAHGGSTIDDLGIPESKKNIKLLVKDIKAKRKYMKKFEKHLMEVLTYAERDQLIQGILIVEQVLHGFANLERNANMHYQPMDQ